jgi:hypothetical protein
MKLKTIERLELAVLCILAALGVFAAGAIVLGPFAAWILG